MDEDKEDNCSFCLNISHHFQILIVMLISEVVCILNTKQIKAIEAVVKELLHIKKSGVELSDIFFCLLNDWLLQVLHFHSQIVLRIFVIFDYHLLLLKLS
jgi:hypothetical protein